LKAFLRGYLLLEPVEGVGWLSDFEAAARWEVLGRCDVIERWNFRVRE
jgi:hypothetical protein